MPGIVGVITKMPRAWAEQQVLQMLGSVRHEKFHRVGTWTDESSGVYVGWVAKAGSFSDGMPLLNEDASVCLVFSGEEFPDVETKSKLRAKGHPMDTNAPSYLVHLYEDNPSFLGSLNGRFHGLLADRKHGTAILFNDRYGMHRVYSYESKEAFYFAPEAKAILQVCPELRSIDARALGEFLACDCVLENRTLFKGIQILPAASKWVFGNGSLVQRGTYFQSREWEDQDPLEAEPYYQELKNVFSQILPRYFNSRQRIAISLTGGLDTRTIMAWRNAPPNSLPCYTFGGMYHECADVRIARRVAKACEQSHKVITVGDEFLSHFSHYAERTVYLTEGSVDVGRSSDLYVSEHAREIAPVKVVGTYGSEILRHAVMFRPEVPSGRWLQPDVVGAAQRAALTYGLYRSEHPVTFAVFRQSPWYHYGILALEESQLTVRAPYLDNDFVRTVFRAPKLQASEKDIRLRLIYDGNPTLHMIRSDFGLGGRGGISAAWAHRSLEFTHKAEYAYDYGMPQWVAQIDHLLSPLRVERLFLGRHKFNHYRIWYRDNLAEYVRQMLLDSRTLSRPYLQRSGVEAIVREHLNGNRNHTTEIHKMLTLELVHRLFIDTQ